MVDTTYEDLDVTTLPDIQDYMLRKLRIQSDIVLHNLSVECIRRSADQLILSLQGYVLAEEKDPVVISCPKTWWDAILDRFSTPFMQDQCEWLVPTYVTVILDPKIIFPKLRLVFPEEEYILL